MKSQATSKFWKLYGRLPRSVQQRARKSYQMWKENPRHPSLHFKRVDDEEPIYSACVDDALSVETGQLLSQLSERLEEEVNKHRQGNRAVEVQNKVLREI